MRSLVLSIAALSFVVQVAVGVPTFGTGLQLDTWNEADNEHPGEYIPDDYMMPMRDPDESVNADTPSEPTPEQPTTTPVPAVEEVTLPKPPTVDEKKTTPAKEKQPDTPAKEPKDVPKTDKEERPKPSNSQVEMKLLDDSHIPLRFPDLDSPGVKRVAIVIRPMAPPTSDDIIRSSRFLQLLQPENRIQLTPNREDMPKAFGRIVMRIRAPPAPTPAPAPATESAPCGMDETSSQESAPLPLPLRPSPVPITLRFRDFPEKKQPTIKGVLLKSLVPREYLVLRDIYNIMKARAAANSNEESGYNQMNSGIASNPVDFEERGPFKPTARYVALPRGPMFRQIPPSVFFAPPPRMEQREPDSHEFLPPSRPRFPQEYDSPEGSPAENIPSPSPFGFDPPKGEGDAVEDLMKIASQMKGLLNMLLTKVPDQDSSDNREPQIPGLESMLPDREEGPDDFRPLHFNRRQTQLSFNK